MREEGKVRAAGCLRLELVGDAAASVMAVDEMKRVTVKCIMHCLHVMLSFSYDENVTGGFAGVRRR